MSGDAQSEEARADPMASDANPVASPGVPLGGMTGLEWTNQAWTDKEWQDWTNRERTDKEWQDWTKSINPVEVGPPPRVLQRWVKLSFFFKCDLTVAHYLVLVLVVR